MRVPADAGSRPPVRKPARGDPVVLDCLARELVGATLNDAAVARAQHIVAPPVERQASEPDPRERGRQEARRPDVEIHRVAVKQQHGARRSARIGLVVGALERDGIGGKGNELRAHCWVTSGEG